MDVVVTTESRFYMGRDGEWTCASGTYGFDFWRRYADVFDRVIVVARCSTQICQVGVPVEGAGVQLWPLEDSQGVWGAIRRWHSWQRRLRPLVDPSRAFILRLPGQIGGLLGQVLRRKRVPFGVEAVGDPAAVFGKLGCRHPLRPGLQFYFEHTMRQMCHEASATAYVTAKHLQRMYPPNEHAFTTHFSSVDLPSSAYVDNPRDYLQRPHPLCLINVATMSQRYKGQHDLIDAVSSCVQAGRAVQLALVGDGRCRSQLERRAKQAHLAGRVCFLGHLPSGEPVRQALDQADLFVLPSLTEGLPRVLIEAQARALPCIGTQVGGIPELLAAGECVPPGKPMQLASTLLALLDDPHRLTRLSQENLQRARRFAGPILRQRRVLFYSQIRHVAEHHASRCLKRAA
jgi:glycosyltransferase involved in cell wall biosynthesis